MNLSTSRLIDITPTICEELAVWPGDVSFTRSVALDVEKGDNITLSAITASVHLGAHTDAPNHYAKGRSGIESRSLANYLGPAQVIRVNLPQGSRIGPEHIDEAIEAERVLFATGSYPDPNHFNKDYCSLSAELVHCLHEMGVKLIGIDTPSIDLFDDKILESHTAIDQHDMAILEGIVLDNVEEGLYTLVALPLKIAGADASPVRAILLPA
jgi:arylformamidase